MNGFYSREELSGDSVRATRLANLLGIGGSTPTSPLFRKEDWEVRDCDLVVCQKLVELYHYSHGGSNTATYSHGLFLARRFHRLECFGIAWYLPPTKSAAEANYSKNWRGVLALSRLVIVPGVPKNACSFLIRHSMRRIDRQVWPYLLSYADEWQDHKGIIYRAAGWKENGYTKPERCYVKNGRMISRKAGPTTRSHREMLEMGCECIGSFRKKRFYHLVEESR